MINNYNQELYISPFSNESFNQVIAKYLDFKYINCSKLINNQIYKITLFKKTDNTYQIGAVGYGCITPFPVTTDVFFSLINILESEYGLITKIILPPFLNLEVEYINCLAKKYDIKELETSVLDLNDYRERGEYAFKGKIRTAIRFAQKNNVKIKKCETQKQLDSFYQFYIQTMQRVNSQYLTPKEMMSDLIFDNDSTYMLLAYVENKIVAGSIFLQNTNHTFYWINASDIEYRNLCCNYYILQKAIELSSGRGNSYFNFGYSHTENILKSKLAWGCCLEKYYILERGKNDVNL